MRGSITDFPVIMALLLSGGISIFLVYLILTAISGAWPAAAGAESAAVLNAGISAFSVFDYMFVFFAVGLGAFTIISGFFINSHPVFFVFSALFLLPVCILTSAQITNAFDAFITADAIVAVANEFPYIVTLMRNLPLFFLVIGIMVAIAVHAKPGGGQI